MPTKGAALQRQMDAESFLQLSKRFGRDRPDVVAQTLQIDGV